MLGKLIGCGYFSDVYDYGGDKVIKLMQKCYQRDFVQSEYEKLKDIHAHYPYSPAVYGIAEHLGRFGIICERLKGRPVSDYILRYVWNLKRYLMILLEYHLKLHSIVSETLPTYLDVLERNLERLQDLTEAQKEFIRKYAASLPQQSFMCHGDFHPDNVIMQKTRIAVVDWSTAYRGNPLSDAVNMKILMKLPIVTKKMFFPINIISRFFKPLIARIYTRAYLKNTGATEEALDAWLLPSSVIRLGEGIPNGQEVLRNIIDTQCKKLGFIPGPTENI